MALPTHPVVGYDTADEMAEAILEHIFFEPLTTCCSRLGLPKRVLNDIVEQTMKAGVHGPAVSIFVVMALLCLAEKKEGGESADEAVMVKIPLMAAAEKVWSFKDLEQVAPTTLEEFLAGYRGAMGDIPAGG
ncbi:unnamed protein product [Pylaiella littoralis]